MRLKNRLGRLETVLKHHHKDEGEQENYRSWKENDPNGVLLLVEYEEYCREKTGSSNRKEWVALARTDAVAEEKAHKILESYWNHIKRGAYR